MSIALEIICFIASLAVTTAVELSTWIGVGGCGWLISSNIVLIGAASWTLTNSEPNSDYVADAITFQSIL